MSLHSFIRDGTTLRYRDRGSGPPVIFQHGLGGDEAQVAGVFPDTPPVRRITLECRGQGGSETGPASALSIASFADDILALAEDLDLACPIVGGISMGAAIALRLAVRHPRRFRALVIARPAWVSAPSPDNMRPYAEVGELLERYPAVEARERFEATVTAALLAREAPDNLASLLGFFGRPDGRAFGQLLATIAADGPGVSIDEISQLRLPTLVLGHAADLAHPLAYAKRLASLIPDAKLVEVTPKAVDRPAFEASFRSALSDFFGSLS